MHGEVVGVPDLMEREGGLDGGPVTLRVEGLLDRFLAAFAVVHIRPR